VLWQDLRMLLLFVDAKGIMLVVFGLILYEMGAAAEFLAYDESTERSISQ